LDPYNAGSLIVYEWFPKAKSNVLAALKRLLIVLMYRNMGALKKKNNHDVQIVYLGEQGILSRDGFEM